MLLQDLDLGLRPHHYERGHVDLAEGCERYCDVLRLIQAHAIHLRMRFIPATWSSRKRRVFGIRFLWSERLCWGRFQQSLVGVAILFPPLVVKGRCLWVFRLLKFRER